MDKQYLGDSVYAEFDGNGIILEADNGYTQIYLDPEVFHALVEYIIGLKRKHGKEE